MTFAWRDYLDLAEKLAAGEAEAEWRSAVSRAYYAAFCSARDWIKAHEAGFALRPDGESHKQVWDEFNRGPERKKKQIADFGKRLRNKRNAADYDAEYPDLAEAKQAALQHAQTILDRLGEL